jgi:hypothetical protein
VRHRTAEPRHATTRRHATKHHESTKERRTAKRTHARHEQREATHLSKRTIRQCHAMSYKQIMRNSNCRSLMKQELASSEHRPSHASRHHKSSHKSASSHRKASTHEKASKRQHGRTHHRR